MHTPTKTQILGVNWVLIALPPQPIRNHIAHHKFSSTTCSNIPQTCSSVHNHSHTQCPAIQLYFKKTSTISDRMNHQTQNLIHHNSLQQHHKWTTHWALSTLSIETCSCVSSKLWDLVASFASKTPADITGLHKPCWGWFSSALWEFVVVTWCRSSLAALGTFWTTAVCFACFALACFLQSKHTNKVEITVPNTKKGIVNDKPEQFRANREQFLFALSNYFLSIIILWTFVQ